MGAACISMCENVESGTWPPFGKTVLDAAAPVNTLLAGLLPLPVTMFVAALPAVFTGPRDKAVDDVPPETTPAGVPVDEPAAVRMYKSRRSFGSFWNPGISSSTT